MLKEIHMEEQSTNGIYKNISHLNLTITENKIYINNFISKSYEKLLKK